LQAIVLAPEEVLAVAKYLISSDKTLKAVKLGDKRMR